MHIHKRNKQRYGRYINYNLTEKNVADVQMDI